MTLNAESIINIKRWLTAKGPQGTLDHAFSMNQEFGLAALDWLALQEGRPVTTDVRPVRVTQIIYKLMMLNGVEVRLVEEKREPRK